MPIVVAPDELQILQSKIYKNSEKRRKGKATYYRRRENKYWKNIERSGRRSGEERRETGRS